MKIEAFARPLVILVEGIGQFRIHEGESIIIEPASHVTVVVGDEKMDLRDIDEVEIEEPRTKRAR